jgi:hypothetical protein
MNSHFPKFDSLSSLSESDKGIALAILGKLPPDLARSWHDQLGVKGGHVSGTYYADVAAVLSYLDFIKLYTALGYTFPKPALWYDMACMSDSLGHSDCHYKKGSTCSLEYCLGRSG